MEEEANARVESRASKAWRSLRVLASLRETCFKVVSRKDAKTRKAAKVRENVDKLRWNLSRGAT